MKKTLFKFWIIILSCFMVLSNASLLAYSEDISDNEKNDIANSFRYTNGETREGHSMSLFLRSAVDSSWPQDSKAIAKGGAGSRVDLLFRQSLDPFRGEL